MFKALLIGCIVQSPLHQNVRKSTSTHTKPSRKHKGISALLDLSDDDSDNSSDSDDTLDADPKKTWLAEFHRYLNSHDYIDDNMSIIHWWGVCSNILDSSDVKGRRTSVKVVKSRPPGFSLTFRTCTFRLIAALTGPTIFSKREAPSVLRKKNYVCSEGRVGPVASPSQL